MGLLSPEDWTASWIEPDLEEDYSISNPAPMLRREFEVKKKVASARAYVTARGLYCLAGHSGCGWRGCDGVLNLAVRRCAQLRATTDVQFVAVVGWRIMGRGDLNPRLSAELARRVGD